jgi:hypothetical protein
MGGEQPTQGLTIQGLSFLNSLSQLPLPSSPNNLLILHMKQQKLRDLGKVSRDQRDLIQGPDPFCLSEAGALGYLTLLF